LPLLAIVAFFALLNLISLIAIANDSWDTTDPEASIAYSILAVAGSGHALYRDYSQFPFTTTPYAPLFYLLAGGFARLMGGSVTAAYLAGRIISLAAFGFSLALVYVLARRAGATKKSAVFATLLACGMPMNYPWAASCRVDFLAMAFSLWGMSLVRTDNEEFQLKPFLIWIIAFFIKPNFIVGPFAWTLYLLFRKGFKPAFLWAVLFGLAISSGVALAEWLTGGKFILNVIKANITEPSWKGMGWASYLWVLQGMIPYELSVFVFGLISGLLQYTRRSEKPAANPLILFAGISTLLFSLANLKAGGGTIYFVEPMFLCAVLTALLMDDLRQWAAESRRVAVDCMTLISCGVVWMFWSLFHAPFWSPTQNIIESVDKPGRRELDELIEHTPGEILFISNGEGMRLRRGLTLHDGYNASYLESYNKISLTSLAQQIAGRKFNAILSINWDEYYGHTIVPPSLIEPIARNYQPAAIYGPYLWMKLNKHAIAPHVPEFPSLTGNDSQWFMAKKYSQSKGDMEVKIHGMLLNTNGYIEKEMIIPRSGLYQFDLRALSSYFPGLWAQAYISVGREYSHVFTIDQPVMSRFSTRGRLRKGTYTIRIGFINDQYKPPYDLNLQVQSLEISSVPIK